MSRKVKIIQNAGMPLLAQKFRPNDPCPCKSGLKLKKCCKTETAYYLSKTKITT